MPVAYYVILWFAVLRVLYALASRGGRSGSTLPLWEIPASGVFAVISCVIIVLIPRSGLAALGVLGVNLATALPLRLVVASTRGKKPYIGIIDFVWITLVASMCSLILYGLTLPVMTVPKASPGYSIDFIKLSVEEARFMFDKTLTALLAYGTVLAGCMAIIWKGEPWRQPAATSAYHDTRRSSIAMAVAFLGSTLAAVVWILMPLYATMSHWRDLAR